ncbi:MAG: sigma-54 dependent transcriptional regulator [bacterium]
MIHIVDDEEDVRTALELQLRKSGYAIRSFNDGASFLAAAAQDPPDVVLLDILMPGLDGLETLSRLNQLKLNCAVIILTGHATLENSFQAMRLGAYDFIPKPFERIRLSVSIYNALRRKDLTQEVRKLREELSARYDFKSIIGVSPAVIEVFSILERLSDSDISVFIQGEAGTGKELAARTLHYNSRRGEGPFIGVNCANMRKDLLESEIFGQERSPGKLERANGGTLYIAEIADMDLTLQRRLLDRIERMDEKGKSGEAPGLDVRFISATSKDLRVEADAGNFDVALLDRLAPFQVRMPALREREGDVPLLAKRFLAQFAQEDGKPLAQISSEAVSSLEAYPWPGNIRELRNVLRQALLLGDGEVIRIEDLPPSVREAAERAKEEAATTGEGGEQAPIIPVKEMEEQLLRRTLTHTGGDIVRSATLLGISRATIYRRLKKFNISRENL